eukprot:5347608-Karenia_brevis.AAC.1
MPQSDPVAEPGLGATFFEIVPEQRERADGEHVHELRRGLQLEHLRATNQLRWAAGRPGHMEVAPGRAAG